MTVWPNTALPVKARQKVQQRRRLREWLALDFWLPEHAAWVLAGVDIERSLAGEPVSGVAYGYTGWGWLPGGHRPEWPQRGEELDDAVNAEINRVHRILVGIKAYTPHLRKKPEQWIEYTRSRDYRPTWLSVVDADKRCALLSISARSISEARRQAGRKGGEATSNSRAERFVETAICNDVYNETLRSGTKLSARRMAHEANSRGDSREEKNIAIYFTKRLRKDGYVFVRGKGWERPS